MAKNHYLHCYKIIATYLATILEGWINGWNLDELVGWSLDIEIGYRKIQGGCFIRWLPFIKIMVGHRRRESKTCQESKNLSVDCVWYSKVYCVWEGNM